MSEVSTNGNKNITKQLKYKCDETDCTDSFSAKSKLAAHKKIHGGKTENMEKSTTPKSGKRILDKLKNTDMYAESRGEGVGEKFSCPICKKKDFLSKKSLAAHKSAHTKQAAKDLEVKKPKKKGGGKYNCTYGNCRQGFDDTERFSAHQRRHFKEPPHNCEYCLKEMPDMGKLRVHIRTHTGVKPFRCKHCPQKFANESNMQKHCLNVHGDTTPYYCPHCKHHLSKPRHWCFRPDLLKKSK